MACQCSVNHRDEIPAPATILTPVSSVKLSEQSNEHVPEVGSGRNAQT
jgi:hypothetical protein